MASFFALLSVGSFLLLIIGLISPGTVSKWVKRPLSRRKIAGILGGVFVVSLIGFDFVTPPNQDVPQSGIQPARSGEKQANGLNLVQTSTPGERGMVQTTSTPQVSTKNQKDLENEKILKGYFEEKFQQSSKAEIQSFSVDDKVITVVLTSQSSLESIAIDSAIVIHRHPEIDFNRIVLRINTAQVAFDRKLFELYNSYKINDLEFIERLEHSTLGDGEI